MEPEDRFEYVLMRLDPKAWAELETQHLLSNYEQGGLTGSPEVDDFLARLQSGKLEPPAGIVRKAP